MDFLLYNPVSKAPVLAIEVDGFSFHKTAPNRPSGTGRKTAFSRNTGFPFCACPPTAAERSKRYGHIWREFL